MNALKIAVAGAGLIGRRHVDLIGESKECTLCAIVDPSPGAVATARNAGAPLFVTLKDLLAQQRPDGVIIATPNVLHVDNAMDCIAAGVAVLVEKPVAHTMEEGLRLCAAIERSGAKVLVGHHRAHSPILATAREIIRQGTLGQVVGVQGSAMFFKPDYYFDEAPWRREPGGGPILINMIHEIGNLRSLLGEITAVQAIASSHMRGYSVEDTVAINLRFSNGALGNFLLSDTAASARSWEQTSQENKSYPTYPDEDCYVIAGTLGSLSIPTMRLKVFGKPVERSWLTPMTASVTALDRSDPLVHQLAHFCAVIRGEASPLVSARDGLMNLRVVDAIAESARTGATVRTDTLYQEDHA